MSLKIFIAIHVFEQNKYACLTVDDAVDLAENVGFVLYFYTLRGMRV